MAEAVKVLGIFGSPRRGGNTEILLEEALKGTEKEGAKVERLYLSNFTITPCIECHGCDRTGNCVVLDDMQKIYPKLLEADVVILASPIFFYGVTGWAKSLIDRSQAFWARKYLLKDPSYCPRSRSECRAGMDRAMRPASPGPNFRHPVRSRQLPLNRPEPTPEFP